MIWLRTRSRLAPFLLVAGCLFHPWRCGSAEAAPRHPGFSTNAADRMACQRQLNILYGAIHQFRKSHGSTLPDKLSDLTPDFIHDPNLLVCPFVHRRGGLRGWKKELRELSPDPHTSYSYEFAPIRVADDQWRGLPRKTWRDFKERVAEQLGPVVPLVRCLDHLPVLNLAMSGQIYESGVYWEKNFSTNDHLLILQKVFAIHSPARALTAADYPPRDPGAAARLLDLTGFYNASLTNSWQGFPGNDLAGLPSGLREFGGILFDVRGVIQLQGEDLPAEFPKRVEGIPVRQTCQRIHFLHAQGFVSRPGTIGGLYVIHYRDGRVEEMPLHYGRQLADWWFDPQQPAEPTDAKVVWRGDNAAAQAYGKRLRLLHATWENPRKEVEIATISFDAGARQDQPFLIAITLE